MPIREKPHRLPNAAYHGKVAVSFTACVENRRPLFTRADVVDTFLGMLACECRDHGSEVAVYCFMPDHLHVILKGIDRTSRVKDAMDSFKYVSGKWLKRNLPQFEWQKDFHDHIIRAGEDGDAHVLYIAMNPVRAGLATSPLDYPFSGSLATDFGEFIANSAM